MKNRGRMTVLMFGMLTVGTGAASAQDWPQWRGPQRDNHVVGFNAPATWPKELKQQWKVPVGQGESSPVLVGDKLYVFARQGGDEVTLCLDAATGKELWKDPYTTAAVKGPAAPHQGPRSTPAVSEGKVCTLGVNGVVSCLDAATGKVVWRDDKAGKPFFATSCSPIIVDGKCIVYGDKLTAYGLADGKPQWQWPGPGAPYGSPVLMTIDGVKQVVTPTAGALAGVSLADGKKLWEIKVGPGGKEYQSNFSTPIVDGQTVYYTAIPKTGANWGTRAFKIAKKDGGFTTTELWKKDFSAHQYHTPLLKDGLLYGVSTDLNFFCMDAKTGDQLWIDKGTQRGKCGSILDVGSVLLALTSDKDLVAFKANTKEFAELAHYRVADTETWSVPIVAGNRIFVKDKGVKDKGGSLALWTIDGAQ
jgi:outer membrane protein assembly factor BamB